MYPPNSLSLVADVGGTNTRVALAHDMTLLDKTVRRYANAEHKSLGDVLRHYLADEDHPDCRAACVAVAGPVSDGVGRLTNLDWSIDAPTLAAAAQAEQVAILNDLQAQGHALPHLDPDHIRPILPAAPAATDATRMVIGVGTGFNIAPVYTQGGQLIVPPSEAGHAILPVRNDEDLRLSQFVATAHGFPGVEDVLSGRGLERLYAFAAVQAGTPAHLSGRAIMAAVQDGTDPVAERAARQFCALLGTVAGNLALIHLPVGGIYLIGGVARAVAPYLTEAEFRSGFRDKGRFTEFMDQFPVSVIEDDYAALIGCAGHLTRTRPA